MLHLIGSIDPRTNFSSALQNEDERFDSNFFLSARFFSSSSFSLSSRLGVRDFASSILSRVSEITR